MLHSLAGELVELGGGAPPVLQAINLRFVTTRFFDSSQTTLYAEQPHSLPYSLHAIPPLSPAGRLVARHDPGHQPLGFQHGTSAYKPELEFPFLPGKLEG